MIHTLSTSSTHTRRRTMQCSGTGLFEKGSPPQSRDQPRATETRGRRTNRRAWADCEVQLSIGECARSTIATRSVPQLEHNILILHALSLRYYGVFFNCVKHSELGCRLNSLSHDNDVNSESLGLGKSQAILPQNSHMFILSTLH